MINWFKALNNKTRILVLMVFLVLLLISLLLILSAGNKKQPGKTIPPIPVFIQSPSPSSRPVSFPVAPPSITQLTAKATIVSQAEGSSVFFPTIAGNYIYYLSDDGTTFYKISLDGKDKQPLSGFLPIDIKNVVWSPDKRSVIIKIVNNLLSSSTSGQFYSSKDPDLTLTNWYYNFDTKEAKQLNTDIQSPIFLQDVNSIAYLKDEYTVSKYIATKNKLYISSVDGSGESLVGVFPEENQNTLVFLGNNLVLSFAAPTDGSGKLYKTDLNTKSIEEVYPKGGVSGINPSPSGEKILVQTTNPTRDTNFLSLMNLSTKSIQDLGISADIRLSAWSSDNNYIYILTSSELKILDSNSLNQTRINISTLLNNSKPDLDSGLLVGSDNHSVYFTIDHKLYKLNF